jgi:hypothetical protein
MGKIFPTSDDSGLRIIGIRDKGNGAKWTAPLVETVS